MVCMYIFGTAKGTGWIKGIFLSFAVKRFEWRKAKYRNTRRIDYTTLVVY